MGSIGRTNNSGLKYLVWIIVAKQKSEDVEEQECEGVCFLR